MPEHIQPAMRAWPFGWLRFMLLCCVLYLFLAYVVLPFFWRHYEHQPSLAAAPKVSLTSDKIPADPLNIGLVGSQEELIKALVDAGWSPADPLSFTSSVEIADSVLFRRADPDAPVSSLYLWGRKQDLAFEQTLDGNARQRHHVRLWRAEGFEHDGRTFWIGAVTFDTSVGMSHTTGQVTHHIAADIDAERDRLIEQLANAGQLIQIFQVTGIGPTLNGRNGGGDRYYSDGELRVGIIALNNQRQTDRPEELESPPLIQLKDSLWQWLAQ